MNILCFRVGAGAGDCALTHQNPALHLCLNRLFHCQIHHWILSFMEGSDTTDLHTNGSYALSTGPDMQ